LTLQKCVNGQILTQKCKAIDTLLQFLEIAQRSKDICTRYNIPLIINDRIDIALAVAADGVHLGQFDMPISIARKLLPQGTIIGISCNVVEHVQKAVQQGADYIGIGAIWGTQTKDMTGKVIGVRNVGKLLKELDGTTVKAVGIGASIFRRRYGKKLIRVYACWRKVASNRLTH
jgi:thiamine-phosphate diphosphorylase / hydroxyethylthiazole kinase